MKIKGEVLLLWQVLCVHWVITLAGYHRKNGQRSRTESDVKDRRHKLNNYFLQRRINGSLHHPLNHLGPIRRSFIGRKVHIKGAPKGVIVTINGQRVDPNTGSTILPIQPPQPAPQPVPLPGRNVPINVHVHVNKKYNDANIIGQRKQPIIITAPNPYRAVRPIVIPMPAQVPAPQPIILPAPLPPPPPAVLPAPVPLPLPAPLPPPVAIPVPAPAPAPPPDKEDSNFAEILQTAALLNTLNKKEESRPKVIPVVQPVITPMAYQPGRNPAQGYPAHGNPNQGYPPDENPNQGYPAGENPNQGYPAGENPNQGYPAGENHNQGYPAGGGNQNQGYPAGGSQNQATAGKAPVGGTNTLSGLSGILPLLLPFNCRCGCERRCPDLCNLCKDVDEEIIDTLDCCKSMPCPCVNAAAGTQPVGATATGTVSAPSGGAVVPQLQQGVVQPAPASTVNQIQPMQISNGATALAAPPQPGLVPPSQPASAPPLPSLSVLPGPQAPGVSSQLASAPPLPASAPPLTSSSALPGTQPPGPALQPASAPPLLPLVPTLPQAPNSPVVSSPGTQSSGTASQPSAQALKPSSSGSALAPAVPPPLPPKPEISPPKTTSSKPGRVPAPVSPEAVPSPEPEIPAPGPPGSTVPPKPEIPGKGISTGTSTEPPGSENTAPELEPPPTDTGSPGPDNSKTQGELVAPPPDNYGPIEIPTVPVLPGESPTTGPSQTTSYPVGPGPPGANPAPPSSSTSSTNPSPPLPSLPLMKNAYPVPPPAPQVFIIKENSNPTRGPEDSKSAEALNSLSESFESAFKEALKSERRKIGKYRSHAKGNFSIKPEEDDNWNTNDSETDDQEEEEDEEKVQSHGGSRRDFTDGEDSKLNEDFSNDDRNDNGNEDDSNDDDGIDDNHDNNADSNTDEIDDDDHSDDNSDDDGNNIDIKAEKEPPYDLDQPRHSHALSYFRGNEQRYEGRRKMHPTNKGRKYLRLHDRHRNGKQRNEETRESELLYDRSVNGALNRDRNNVHSRYHRKKFPLSKTEEDKEMSPEHDSNSIHVENVQYNPLENNEISRLRHGGASRTFKSPKHSLKSPESPKEKHHVPYNHDRIKFRHFQDKGSDKHAGHDKEGDHTFIKEHHGHHLSHSKTAMLPEDEITEESASTIEETSYSGHNEKVKSLKSLKNFLTYTHYAKDASHHLVEDTRTKDKKTPLGTVESFKSGNHRHSSKHSKSKQEKDIAEDYSESSGNESGQNYNSGDYEDIGS